MKKKNQLLKAFMVAAAVSISGAAMSQVEIGIRAGANFSNTALKDANDKKVDTKLNPGWHAGVTFDIPVADEFYVQPGALFSTKGYKTDNSYFDGNANTNSKVTASYIEVPVNLLYKPELGSGKLLLGVGPYVAYGVGGKWDSKFSSGNTSISTDGSVEFKGDYDDRSGGDKRVYGKPFDAGANLLFGYEFANKLSFQLNGQLGLLNAKAKNDPRYNSVKNTGFGISVGYKF
ncbi:MAG: PorT family protein [Niabella sp.]|nr:PorT family protein [Niabella sp.]